MNETSSAGTVSVFGVILVSLIQFECGKIRTRITPNTDTFYGVQERLCEVQYMRNWLKFPIVLPI